MAIIINIDDLKLQVEETELLQIAGIGSHNVEGGRSLDIIKITEAIDFANDMITGYLRKRYAIIDSLAVEDQPQMLKGMACDITRYRLRGRSGNKNQTSDEVRNRNEQAMSYMGKASRGLVDVLFIGVDDLPSEAGSATKQVLVSHAPEVAGNLMRGYDAR